MLKLSEFIEGVKNNTITNYDEYLHGKDTWEHREYPEPQIISEYKKQL